jgi:hypothetical protein
MHACVRDVHEEKKKKNEKTLRKKNRSVRGEYTNLPTYLPTCVYNICIIITVYRREEEGR